MTLRAIIWAAVSTLAQAEAEKESIPSQIRDAEAFIRREGFILADEPFVVPGHSRDYIDIHELAADARAVGIDAFDRLLKAFKTRSFDVMVVRDAHRFARTQSLHAYVTESVIKIGARIYSFTDGWIDDRNFRMFISMSGYKAASEKDELKKKYEFGMRGRLNAGLSGAHPPFSHRLIRENGEQYLVLDESKQRFWTDLYELFLGKNDEKPVGFNKLGVHMAKRGHLNAETGRQYSAYLIWRLLNSPFTWGHVAFRFDGKWGAWAYNPSEPLPPGVEIRRDVIQPVYAPNEAKEMIAELERRRDLAGRAKPQNTRRYSHLLMCTECGYQMNYSSGRYGCMTRWTQRKDITYCNNTAYVTTAILNEQVTRFLRRYLGNVTELEAYLAAQDGNIVDPVRLVALDEEIQTLDNRAKRLIVLQADHPSLEKLYAEQITQTASQLDALKAERNRLAATADSPQIREQRALARDEIIGLGVDAFMASEDTYVNQVLRRLLGHHKFAIRNGEVERLKRYSRRNRWNR